MDDKFTNITATDFLKQSVKIYRKLDCALERLQGLQDLSKRITPILNGTPSVSTKSYSKIEAAVLNMQEQSETLGDNLAEFLEVQEKISAAIAKVPDENERFILESRYLNFKTWKYIARLMNVKLARVYQLHQQAILSFEKIFAAEQTRVNYS